MILFAIKSYQATASLRLPCCRFYPSCSNYAKDAVEKHGVAAGAVLGLLRILRCHPFSAGGVDMVPSQFRLN